MNLRGKDLYQHQEDAVNLIRKAVGRYKRVVLQLPTGGGKTVIGAAICQLIAKNPNNGVAFVVNRIQLLAQTSRSFTHMGIHHGIIHSSNTKRLGEQVIIASYQSLEAGQQLPDHINFLLVDECHSCAGGKHYQELFKDRMVIGLSATPEGKGMARHVPDLNGPLFHPKVFKTESGRMPELIERGLLTDYKVFVGPEINTKTFGTNSVGDYREDRMSGFFNSRQLIGNTVEQWATLGEMRSTMVFAVDIPHSKNLVDQFRERFPNLVIEHVDCKMPTKIKQEIYGKFEAGNINIICNAVLLGEGTDFPRASCIVLAKSTKVRKRYVQMVGRVLRPFKGKTMAIVLDQGGNYERFGPVEFIEYDELCDGDVQKSKAKEQEAIENKEPTVRCPNKACSCCFQRKLFKCPYCGHKLEKTSEVEHTQDNLREAKKPKAKKKKTGREETQDMDPTEVYAHFEAYRVFNKWGHAWTENKMRDLFPKGYKKPDYVMDDKPFRDLPDCIKKMLNYERRQNNWKRK